MNLRLIKNGDGDLSRLLVLALSRSGVSRTQAFLGNRSGALDECNKTKSLLDHAVDDPANAHQRGMKAETYASLGEAYSSLAGGKSALPNEREQLWLASREMYQRSLEIWEDMRNRGILSTADTNRPDEVRRTLDKVK